MIPNFVEYNNTDILMESLALTVTEELKKLLDEKELVTLSLPGGSTPKPLFDRLSMKKLDWQRIVVIPNDERFVPETSMLSNCGLIRKTLLKNFANEFHNYVQGLSRRRQLDRLNLYQMQAHSHLKSLYSFRLCPIINICIN